MRFLLVIVFGLALASSSYGQFEDHGTLEKILTADKHPYYNPMGDKSYQAGGSLALRPSKDQNAYLGTKDFSTESFTTRSFLGIKNPWFGSKVFTTDTDALVSKEFLRDGSKKFETSTAAVRPFYESKKGVDVSTQVVPTKPFLEKGATQDKLNLNKKKLTIDDIREILNKNQ